jgi:hypothetical protein
MDEADRLLELGTDVHKSEGLFLPYNRLHELPAVSLFDKTPIVEAIESLSSSSLV